MDFKEVKKNNAPKSQSVGAARMASRHPKPAKK
jgi:hypothetical protein